VDRTDTFAGANILSIAVEAPNDMLGQGPIGAWVTISLRRDGILVPMDRGGNPSFNPILNANDIKDEFNATDPVDDVKNYLQPLSETLQRHGYPLDEATAAARTLLPDILHYDRTGAAEYPNGRVPTDDVFSTRMIFMTHGQTTPQRIGPHDDLLAPLPLPRSAQPLIAHPPSPRRRPSPAQRPTFLGGFRWSAWSGPSA